MELVAKTLFGLEEVLKKEILDLGGSNVEAGNRVVTYSGDKELLYKSNLWLRTAITILQPIQKFRFRDQEDLKKKFEKINFGQFLTVDKSFAVKGAVNSPLFTYTKYPMLLLKDAIADHFMDKMGKRPDVDLKRPQILFDLHISNNECTISLNSSGAPLFQRGYRRQVGLAPLNEVAAAGLILLSGWDRSSHLIDIFCGSGTIPIEAAMIANDIPPNLIRKHYSFQNWADYDKKLWESIYNSVPKTPKRDLKFQIIGSDTDGEMVLKARQNAKALPLGRTLEFQIKDFRDFVAPEAPGVMISNLPYGERLDVEDISNLYKETGDYMKHKLPGYSCWILSSDVEALKSVELKPSAKLKMYNGSLECEFRKFEIFKGSLVEHKFGEVKEK